MIKAFGSSKIRPIDETGEYQVLISNMVYSPKSVTLLSDEEDKAIMFDCVRDKVYSCHILSKKVARGRNLWLFALKALRRIIEDYSAEYFMMFVKKDRKDLVMFLSQFKVKPKIEIGSDYLYVVSKDEVLYFKLKGVE